MNPFLVLLIIAGVAFYFAYLHRWSRPLSKAKTSIEKEYLIMQGKNDLIVDAYDADLLHAQCSDTNSGYARAYLNGEVQLVHRIIYERVYNVAPDGSVRHIDGNRKNCRRNNIAFETGQDLNLADDNWNKDHKLGRGVYQRKSGVYFVRVCKNYHQMAFGDYDDLQDAINVAEHVRELAKTMPKCLSKEDAHDLLLQSIDHPSYSNRRR